MAFKGIGILVVYLLLDPYGLIVGLLKHRRWGYDRARCQKSESSHGTKSKTFITIAINGEVTELFEALSEAVCAMKDVECRNDTEIDV